MIKFTFDNGTVESFTLVLSTRDYRHLGQLSNIDELKYTGNLNSANEMSFKIYKMLDDHKEVLWEDVYDLRLVYVKELDEYFEISVELTDEVYMTKTITARSLCESELSQVYLHNIEINTPEDIAREGEDRYDEYLPTIFYRSLVGLEPGSDRYKRIKSASLIHRILEKVPAYSIGEIDESLIGLMRTFSISDSTVYDFLTGECAEQFNCLFIFDSKTRKISVRDLYSVCQNTQCDYYLNPGNKYYSGLSHKHYRKNFGDCCPICGSSNVYRFGEDTTVFVSTENLTDAVTFDTLSDNVKNCFRLEAGDDDMTAAVVNINPNGSQYIYEFSKEALNDMPKELVDIIDQYNIDYDYWNNEAIIDIDSDIKNKFNALCDKYNNDAFYKNGDNPWPKIGTIKGYSSLMPIHYECEDFYSYLKSSMMPPVDLPKPTVESEVAKLNDIGEVAVNKTSTASTQTVNSAVLAYAKIIAYTGYVKIEIDPGSYYNSSSKKWYGRFKVTSYEDQNVVGYSDNLTIRITEDLAKFTEQKIQKQLLRNEDDDYSIETIMKKPLGDFVVELRKWSVVRLESFRDAAQAVMGILIEAGQGNAGTPENNYSDKSLLYDNFYYPYYEKQRACEDEINLRNEEMAIIYGATTRTSFTPQNSYELPDGDIIVGVSIHDGKSQETTTQKGMIQYIDDEINRIRQLLFFKNYIYNKTGSYDLYNIYTTYIREDTYSNSNYISDGLMDDPEKLFDMARQFMEKAKEELHTSATYQHSISSTLNNLLTIEGFKPIVDKFELGNWIRVQADEVVYRLRLISYSIDFDALETINVDFSDVTITANGFNDINSILNEAKSLSTSYNYVEQQAEKGAELKDNYIDRWVEEGLNSALVKINNNTDEDIVIDSSGITAKTHNDEISTGVDPKQLRITHNVLAFTDNNWESVKTGLGEFEFKHHQPLINGDTTVVVDDKYGLVAEAVLAGWVVGSHIESSDMISGHIQNIGNSNYIDLTDTVYGDTQQYFLKCGNNFYVDKSGNVTSRGGRFEKDANNFLDFTGKYDFLRCGDTFVIDNTGVVTSKAGVFKMDNDNYINLSGKMDYLHFSNVDNEPIFRVDKFGSLYCKDGHFSGDITASTITGSRLISTNDGHRIEIGDGIIEGYYNNVLQGSIKWCRTHDRQRVPGLNIEGLDHISLWVPDNTRASGAGFIITEDTIRFQYPFDQKLKVQMGTHVARTVSININDETYYFENGLLVSAE